MTQLATTGGIQLPEQKNAAAFDKIAKAGDWLQRVQLYGANSKDVKALRIPMAHYGLVKDKDNIIDLGTQFDSIPLRWRSKAVRFGAEDVLNFYDPEDEEFLKIMEESEIPDSDCMYGPEFLMWLPSHKKFVTFFCNSKTSRKMAPDILGLLGQPMTLKVKFIETKKYSWHGPVAVPCSTPIVDLPSQEQVLEQINKFDNPPKQEIETADNADQRAR
jgi:hypothetical protein